MIRTLACLLVLVCLTAGCGNGGDDAPPAFVVPTVPDTAVTDTADVAPDSLPLATPVPADETAQPPAEGTPARPAPPTAEPPADRDPTPTPPEDDRWTTGDTDVTNRPRTTPVLQSVRSARHPAHDRLVFEFEGGLPGYHIAYIDRPVRECGSGNTVSDLGRYDGLLSIRFSIAQAHTADTYQPTIRRTLQQLGFPNAKAYRLVCDFEGNVEIVLGLDAPTPYRAIELANPPRLALDVQH